MLTQLTTLLGQSCPSYHIEYEESSMMNVRADEIALTGNFIYIEEFRRGKILQTKFGPRKKQMRMQVYFCKFAPLHHDATAREQLRENIIAEAVNPFIDACNHSHHFEPITGWELFYPLPRFDANEVSVMLEFDCIMAIC